MTDGAVTDRPFAPPKSDSRWGAQDDVYDVLVVGAGISGIGACYHLQTQCPWARFVTLEAQQGFGGTWRTHRYPGARSDSDLYTFGYRFKPWEGAPIATAEEINRYLGEVIAENNLDRHIRYNHTVVGANWSSAEKLWSVEVKEPAADAPVVYRARFLWMCQGYYRHDEGYTPEWEGLETFAGKVVHPQTWPDDLEVSGKHVVVIGSGATAATLVPALAAEVEHVTMLQRSPTWFIPGRNVDDLADILRELEIDPVWTHEIIRRKRVREGEAFAKRAREDEESVKQELLAGVAAFLGPDFDIQKHFTPTYRPWRQRIAFIPDGDLFQSIASGKASMATGDIDRFVEEGVRLTSGEVVKADIVVTATGFKLSVLGDIPFSLDGVPVDWSDTVTYRGMMFSGVPNLAWVFGYFRASWTLRVDLMGDFLCRLLNGMKASGRSAVRAEPTAADAEMERLPWIDPADFNPGYLMRDMHQMPKRGDQREWSHTQDYLGDARELPKVDLDHVVFQYE